ncbi:MAG: HAD family hydrolase [Gemmatimonadota bacterium]
MNLALFDIDGTLLDNTATEDACFVHALQTGLGLDNIDLDWSTYQHVTDHGIACEAYQRATGSLPSPAALARTAEHFVDGLSEACRHAPIQSVSGAAHLLDDLPRQGWMPVLATVAWHRAAIMKLRSAGLPAAHLVLATAEDGPARVSVFRTALERACYPVDGHGSAISFDRVVLIGDGVWDIAVARELGVPFVGRGVGSGAARLGAKTVTEDFTDRAAVLQAFETAGCF